MKTEIHLKHELLRLEQDREGNEPRGILLSELVPVMMKYIGSTDAELRDHLIYGSLCRWTEQDRISADMMREIAAAALDDQHLFYKIGERGTDSVFTRTFSALIIPVALYKHGRHPFLTEAEIRGMKEKLIRYLALEKDLRGYVEGKGWAHAAAHAADGLESLARLEAMNRQDLHDMLAAIGDCICTGRYLYINDEDERLVNAAVSIWKRHLIDDDMLLDWVRSIADPPLNGSMHENETLRANTKHFLRSLYFEMLKEQDTRKCTPFILEQLNLRNRY